MSPQSSIELSVNLFLEIAWSRLRVDLKNPALLEACVGLRRLTASVENGRNPLPGVDAWW